MKTSIFSFLAVMLCLSACQIEIDGLDAPNEPDNILSAKIEQAEVTKTTLSESNNVLWSEYDQIVAFMKSSYGQKYQIQPSFAGQTSADFSRTSSEDFSAGVEWDHNVAYYPYSESIECVKYANCYILNVLLPSVQTYVENSFENGAFPMVAISEDNNITFKNVFGGIKIPLKGTLNVKSIKIEGNNNEKLSGAATVTAYMDGTIPVLTMATSSKTSMTLNCGDAGVTLSESAATEFIIALPPTVFSNGFTITISDSDDKTYTVEADMANTILRSSILIMPAVKLENKVADDVSANGDYVDEYGINHGKGIAIGDYVWAPVNCGYRAAYTENGTSYKGFPYGKLYQWGRKYGQGLGGSYDDAIITYEDGGVLRVDGRNEAKANVFFCSSWDTRYDWCGTYNDPTRWNSGTSSEPVKTKNDPCPKGWRVPTMEELSNLANHSYWSKNASNQNGCYLSGDYKYKDGYPGVFLSASGLRFYSGYDSLEYVGSIGFYWTSTSSDHQAKHLEFADDYLDTSMGAYHGNAFSVRCIQEAN